MIFGHGAAKWGTQKAPALCLVSFVVGCSTPLTETVAPSTVTVADTPTTAQTSDGEYISWIEHIIDDEASNGGVPIRGGDGIAIVDLDQDGYLDILTAQEDSNHLRIAYGTSNPNEWVHQTLAEGPSVAAIEDVAVGDLNGDGWVDIVAACEEAHLIYFENPIQNIRDVDWPHLIPTVVQDRGSWLRVFIADVNGDGQLDLTAANKGAADIVRPGVDVPENGPTSLFTLNGPPLEDASWQEQILYNEGVPNTALPVDIDGDGDFDILAAKRVRQELVILENLGRLADGSVNIKPIPITMRPAFEANPNWRGMANAFQADIADLNRDGRVDLIVNVIEVHDDAAQVQAGIGWLEQPEDLSSDWLFRRIGNTLPDWVIGIKMADIDGDGDLDAVTGGYSGINILAGAYSGASRDYDEPSVDENASVGRIAWFENPGDPTLSWTRHDISRRVRGMYDMFESRDIDGDGDTDLIAPRGNSGSYDGVFWLEQIRSNVPRASFTPAREEESRHLGLPPEDWITHYNRSQTYVAPNKSE